MDAAVDDRIRALCLAFPEAEERETWDEPTYRVRGRIFAMTRAAHDQRPSVWCKAPQGQQAVLMREHPERYFAPPYVGPKGWVGVWLDTEADWDEVAAIVRRSYLLVAPRGLAKAVAGG